MHPYFQMGTVTVFEFSPVHIGYVQSIPVGYFSQTQLV